MCTDGRKDARLTGLYGNVSVITTKEHGFGHDAVLLAAFARPRKGGRVCDFGTGCGIIPLLLCRHVQGLWIDAVEINHEAAVNAARSAAVSGLSDVIHVVEGNYNACQSLPKNGYDLITCNPPYRRADSGKANTSDAVRMARIEPENGLSALLHTAAALLKNGGRFCVCYRPERLAELFCEMRAAGLEPKRLRLVQHRTEKAPWLLLAEGRKNARPGLFVAPALMVEEPNGALTEEIRVIYGDYCREKPVDLGAAPL